MSHPSWHIGSGLQPRLRGPSRQIKKMWKRERGGCRQAVRALMEARCLISIVNWNTREANARYTECLNDQEFCVDFDAESVLEQSYTSAMYCHIHIPVGLGSKARLKKLSS